jgi:hypothetical protein
MKSASGQKCFYLEFFFFHQHILFSIALKDALTYFDEVKAGFKA